ncbi:hypothetical protein [Methylobacterium sp. SyP6R]|uniref:hypothetical protein n=1 Tax=Methylobacterium sp. SyP6R TaxID=2718876 RepID=UPI001F40D478|nr:hypothetical protein [Methylobacterium sp. SyP6R]MCF4129716.1 hypothetical protein [Methylobacterium sp. SyP6R]
MPTTPPVSRRILGRAQVAAMLVAVLAPLAWTVLSSFKVGRDVMALPPQQIFTPTLDNYRELFLRTDFLH